MRHYTHKQTSKLEASGTLEPFVRGVVAELLDATHGAEELLSMRMNGSTDPDLWEVVYHLRAAMADCYTETRP